MADDTGRGATRFERLRDVVPRPLASELRRAADRRNLAGRAGLALRVQHEYEEMPGLTLTPDQARRLFALRPDICERVLDELVRCRVLDRTRQGQYVLHRTVA